MRLEAVETSFQETSTAVVVLCLHFDQLPYLGEGRWRAQSLPFTEQDMTHGQNRKCLGSPEDKTESC